MASFVRAPIAGDTNVMVSGTVSNLLQVYHIAGGVTNLVGTSTASEQGKVTVPLSVTLMAGLGVQILDIGINRRSVMHSVWTPPVAHFETPQLVPNYGLRLRFRGQPYAPYTMQLTTNAADWDHFQQVNLDGYGEAELYVTDYGNNQMGWFRGLESE